jgi:hypothetical protein
VSLFVGPTWSALDHGGVITDRVLPGTSTPCVYLEQGSEVRVQILRQGPTASMEARPLADSVVRDFSSAATGGAETIAGTRRMGAHNAIVLMTITPIAGGLCPFELIHGFPPPGAEVSVVVAGLEDLHPDAAALTRGSTEDSSGWGERSMVPILWGRPDPPPHPDEGLAWSNISDRAARNAWDVAKGSASP